MTQETFTRELLVEASKDADQFPVVLSSETPVLRGNFWEVLDHSQADLSRAPLPLIESHDSSRLNIGVVESLRAEGGKLRGVIRLGKTQRAKELAEDIAARIVRCVSIGYSIGEGVRTGIRDGLPIIKFPFQPFELSLVAAPADTSTGIYRSNKPMTTETETKPETVQASAAERERIQAIRKMGEGFHCKDQADRAIDAGVSVEQFRTQLITHLENTRSVPSADLGFTPAARYAGMPADASKYGRALGEYSLLKVLRGLSDPKPMAEAGLELSISQDMQRDTGRRSKGIVMPYEMLATRTVTKGGSGGNLIATEHLGDQFVDVLRARSAVLSMNPTVLNGLQGDVSIPRKTAGATGYWIAGDDADSITASDLTLDEIALSPKTVGGAVTFSHKMLMQSSPGIEGLVRTDLADLIAQKIDVAALAGTAASNQPRGIINTSGIYSDTWTTAPTWAEYVAMETAIATANADQGDLAFLMTSALAGLAKVTPRQSSGVEGNFILQDGMINGHRAITTNNMPTGNAILGHWASLIIAMWGGIELDADGGGTNFLKGSITVRALADIDIGVRQAAAFALILPA